MNWDNILLFILILLIVVLSAIILAKFAKSLSNFKFDNDLISGEGPHLDALADNVLGPVVLSFAKNYIPQDKFEIANYAPIDNIDVKCNVKPKIALHVDSTHGLGFAVCLPNKQIIEYNLALNKDLHKGYTTSDIRVEPPEKIKARKISIYAWDLAILSIVIAAVSSGLATPDEIKNAILNRNIDDITNNIIVKLVSKH